MNITGQVFDQVRKPRGASHFGLAIPPGGRAVERAPSPTVLRHHLPAAAVLPHRPAPIIQPKLQVGPVNDRYEQEADRVADQVMRMPAPAALQRKSRTEEDDEDAGGLAGQIQRRASSLTSRDGFPVAPNVEARLAASRGGGAPLPSAVRAFMEPRFRTDFSNVRLHAGPDAGELNREVRARAFTHGQHIYLGSGESAGSDSHLLAHELTHVLQQTGTVQRVDLTEGMVSDEESELGWTNRKQKETYRKKIQAWAGDSATGILAWLKKQDDYGPEDVDMIIENNPDAARWLAGRQQAAAAPQPAAAPSQPAPKPVDHLADVKAAVRKLRKTKKDLSNFTDEDLETIRAAKENAKPQISFETAILNQDQVIKQAGQKAALAEDRKAKWAPALPIGEAAFAGNALCLTVWRASHGVATGDINQNASVGGKHTDGIIAAAVQRWRNQPTITTPKGKVYDFHVPGKANFIQDKSKRPVNPDPTRGRQADFISNWANLKVNLHVDADPEH